MKNRLILIILSVMFLGFQAQAKVQLIEQDGMALTLKLTDTDAVALRELVGLKPLVAAKEDFSTIRGIHCTETACELKLHGELRQDANGLLFLLAPPAGRDLTVTNTTMDGALTRILVDASYKNSSIQMRTPKREKLTPSTLYVSILETETKLGALDLKCGNRLGLWSDPFILQSFCSVQGNVQGTLHGTVLSAVTR